MEIKFDIKLLGLIYLEKKKHDNETRWTKFGIVYFVFELCVVIFWFSVHL